MPMSAHQMCSRISALHTPRSIRKVGWISSRLAQADQAAERGATTDTSPLILSARNGERSSRGWSAKVATLLALPGTVSE